MENREIDAAGKEHRPESSPFLTIERDNSGKSYSQKNIFWKKREEEFRGFVPKHRFPRESDLSDSSDKFALTP